MSKTQFQPEFFYSNNGAKVSFSSGNSINDISGYLYAKGVVYQSKLKIDEILNILSQLDIMDLYRKVLDYKNKLEFTEKINAI